MGEASAGLASKRCGRCNIIKPTSEFHRDRRFGIKSYCKLCSVEHRRQWIKKQARYDNGRVAEWRRENPDKVFSQHLRRYGFTPADYSDAMARSDGKCVICTAPFGKDTPPHIDHCHDSGRLRGLLCMSCNIALGHFKDDVDRLRRAISYLEQRTAPDDS